MSEAHSPRVSVIVPAYNKPEYLPECLRSVQAQTFTDWECIVVNDGSPRGDEIRAAVAAMNDPRFRLVEHEKNLGPGAARNTGVSAAKGEVIVFVDSDDCILPEFLARTLRALGSESAGYFVSTVLQRFGKETRLKDIHFSSLAEDTLRGNFMPPAGGLVLWKSDFFRAGGFSTSGTLRAGHEDTEFWLRAVLRHGLKVKVLDDPLYLWRATDGSLSGELQAKSHVVRRWLLKHYLSETGTPADRARFLADGYKRASFYHLMHGHTVRAITLRLGYCYYLMRYEPVGKSLRGLLSFAREAWRRRAMRMQGRRAEA